MKYIFKTVLTSLVVLIFVCIPIATYADNAPGSAPIVIHNPLNCGVSDNDKCTLVDFINIVLQKVVMPIAAVVAVLYIMWAGFTYVTAQGKPAEIQKAHDRLLYALIGTGILLGAAGISAVIVNTVHSIAPNTL